MSLPLESGVLCGKLLLQVEGKKLWTSLMSTTFMKGSYIRRVRSSNVQWNSKVDPGSES